MDRNIDEYIQHHYMTNAQLAICVGELKNIELLFLHQPHVSNEVIHSYSYKIDWKMVLKYNRLVKSHYLLDVFKHQIDWEWLVKNYKLELSAINSAWTIISDESLLKYVDVPDDFIIENGWYFRWKTLARCGRFKSVRLLEKYRFHINFHVLFAQQFSFDIEWCIDDGLSYTAPDITQLIQCHKLSIYRLRTLVNGLDDRYPHYNGHIAVINNHVYSIKFLNHSSLWDFIVKYQRLTVQFIIDFMDYLDWTLISKYQRLKNLHRFRYRLDWNIVVERYRVRMSDITKLNKSTIIGRIFNYPIISRDVKHKNAALIIQRTYKSYQLRNKVLCINKFNMPKEACSIVLAFLG